MSFHLLPIGCQDANLRLYIRFTAAAPRLTVHQSINMSSQGKYLERRIADTESCEVYSELQVWKGHIVVRQRFSEVKD